MILLRCTSCAPCQIVMKIFVAYVALTLFFSRDAVGQSGNDGGKPSSAGNETKEPIAADVTPWLQREFTFYAFLYTRAGIKNPVEEEPLTRQFWARLVGEPDNANDLKLVSLIYHVVDVIPDDPEALSLPGNVRGQRGFPEQQGWTLTESANGRPPMRSLYADIRIDDPKNGNSRFLRVTGQYVWRPEGWGLVSETVSELPEGESRVREANQQSVQEKDPHGA